MYQDVGRTTLATCAPECVAQQQLVRYADGMAAPAATLTEAKLRRLIDTLGGQSEVARLLHVDRSRVSRWLRGEEPDPKNMARLEALEYVLSRLLRTMHPSTARKWLRGFNAHLGDRRPLYLLEHGRVAEVLAALEQDELGSYA